MQSIDQKRAGVANLASPENSILSPASVKSEPIRKKNQHKHHGSHPSISVTPFAGPDSSSNTSSSCTSSGPSSPAHHSSSNLPTPISATLEVPGDTQFHFPDVSGSDRRAERADEAAYDSRVQSQDSSDKTMSVQSTDSDRTLRSTRLESQDSHDEVLGGRWPRQNSLTSKEWEIPFDELKIEEEIGTGRFGTVYKGQWYGAVAIKRLNFEQGTDSNKYMEAFRQEVATFRKTRHENLVLFMGACMEPPNLAIVTSLCKGLTLFTHIHERNHRFPASRAMAIAQQICQGMSYLHARDVLHKDLKSKNVFYENGKVVITDFGLLSVTRLCQSCRFVLIPRDLIPAHPT